MALLTNYAIAGIIDSYVRKRSFDNKEGQGGYSHFVRRDVDTGASQDLFCIHFCPYQFLDGLFYRGPFNQIAKMANEPFNVRTHVDIFHRVYLLSVHRCRSQRVEHIPTRYLHREPESDRSEMYLFLIALLKTFLWFFLCC